MPSIRQILCAVDASEPSAQALRQALAFARWSGARLTVLHAAAPVHMPMSDLLPLTVDRPGTDTSRAISEWMQRQFSAVASASDARPCLVVQSGTPATTITRYAAELPADL